MRRKCDTCLCRTCLNTCCDRKNCTGKKETCENYNGFRQLSIFEPTQQQTGTPRHPIEYYGLTNERVAELVRLIQSDKYSCLASQVAHRADKDAAWYILLSIKQNLSYDAIEKLWARGEVDRIPCSRTGFYYVKKYFYHLFDLEVRKIT